MTASTHTIEVLPTNADVCLDGVWLPDNTLFTFSPAESTTLSVVCNASGVTLSIAEYVDGELENWSGTSKTYPGDNEEHALVITMDHAGGTAKRTPKVKQPPPIIRPTDAVVLG